MKDKKETIEISCGIIPVFIGDDKKEEFLLVKANNKFGHFSFPKGHQEVNESFLDTAKRELKEETSLSCEKVFDDVIFIDRYTREDNGFKKEIYYFIALVGSKKVVLQKEEISDYIWSDETNILKKISYDSTRNIFYKVLIFLGKDNK